MFVPIANEPRNYAWGSRTMIAEYLGRPASGEPEAELWLGDHPGSPATIVDRDATGGAADLAAWIAADPATALGAASGERLPFLLKVLAADGPLSLQAHPTPDRARERFEFENDEGIPLDAYNRNYRDPFHKPELIVAVSETFDALCGFRALDESRTILSELRAIDAATPDAQPGALDLLDARLVGDTPIHDAVEWLLRDGRGGDTGEVQWLVERVVHLAALAPSDSAFADVFDTVGVLAATYPGDPGIVISLLVNRVTLTRGEALYLPAGNIHAYLHGLGIELMAASDNVLRGGLTPKHIDVTELLEVLDFEPVPVPRLEPETPSAGVEVFRPDVPDFVLYHVTPGAEAAAVEIGAAAILLCTSGSLEVTGSASSVTLARGEAVYATPDEGALTVVGRGELFLATSGR
ncbi:mannose-6-phosphate isomerase, class I [Agromyces atrinae]|uniref:mannose-6-phosphate isomerase, class I n=1 Tax=Agromyces atrinae TaxID=592376 RepID=UPI001F586FA7|nr:mannose-6-phosphate isomerase, class I [Agromyces atrinae]MCI2958033.1 mannose-6-phosphate isomerase, class I [Agromyces atrinae]